MGIPEQFEAVGQDSAILARNASQFADYLGRFGRSVEATIGGTASGDDRRMLDLAQRASEKLRRAADLLNQASLRAREAAVAERERQRREAARQQAQRKQ